MFHVLKVRGSTNGTFHVSCFSNSTMSQLVGIIANSFLSDHIWHSDHRKCIQTGHSRRQSGIEYSQSCPQSESFR